MYKMLFILIVIDPNTKYKLQSSEYSQGPQRGAGERTGYMKLKTKVENSADGYTKPLRARSLDGEFGTMCVYVCVRM